jgi:hypothetical protein
MRYTVSILSGQVKIFPAKWNSTRSGTVHSDLPSWPATAPTEHSSKPQPVKFGNIPGALSPIREEILEKMDLSATEITEGKHFDHFIVPSVQGGAGTSINMNINEIIANVSAH